MASIIPTSGPRHSVKVFLRDLRDREEISLRTIQLNFPIFEIKIGRGSQTEPQLHPRSVNAWFTSRVMSREHAVLRADPENKRIFLQDAGSMHGTYLDGVRLQNGQEFSVLQDQRIQFGTEIVRGDQTYKPLELSLSVDWNNQFAPQHQLAGYPDPTLASKNSFSVDYSDEEEEADNEVEVVYETIRISDQEVNRQFRTFSVPDSDESDSSVMEKNPEAESAPSSPAEPTKLQSEPTAPVPVIINATKESNRPTMPLHSELPGSSMHSALNVSDDEDFGLHRDDPFVDSSDEDHGCSDDEDDYEQEENVSCSDVDEDLDEEEEEHAWKTMQPLHLSPAKAQTQNEAFNRAPSPSDAAMPKPSWCTSVGLPTIQGLVDQSSTQSMYNDTFAAVQQPMTQFQQFGYYTMPWSPADANSFAEPYGHRFAINPLQHVPQHLNRTPLSVSGTTTQPPQQSLSCTMPTSVPESGNNDLAKDTDNGDDKNDNLPKPSKFSINDIIDNVRPDTVNESSTRKRKAEEISASNSSDRIANDAEINSSGALESEIRYDTATVSDTNTTGEAENSTESHSIVNTIPETTAPTKKTVTFSPDAVIIEPEPELERPLKRVKVTQEKSSGTFIKYAATAIAGATLGAMGTVFGLAALPADYFT